MQTIALDKVRMTVIETAPNGVVNRDTLFLLIDGQPEKGTVLDVIGGKGIGGAQ